MADFASVQEAATALARNFARELQSVDSVIVVHEAMLEAMRVVVPDVHLAVLERTADGVIVLQAHGGDRVAVVDLGVETGTTALAIATYLREQGAVDLVLVAAVIPRELEPLLRQAYSQRHALVRPLARRALSWHIGQLP